MSAINVSQVMSRQVATVIPECSVQELVSLMRSKSHSCLVVVENQKPVGIITERDVVRLTNLLLQGTDPSNLNAKNLMTHPVTSIRQQARLTEVAALCKDRKIRHLPVVDDKGLLVGILTQSDLVKAYIQLLEVSQSAALTHRPADIDEEFGDGIPPANLDAVEEDLKQVFMALHTAKNPSGSTRLQSRFT